MDEVARTVLAPGDLASDTLTPWIAQVERFDAAGWPLVLLGNCDQRDPLDGLAMAAFCAAKTCQIGLCATVVPERVEPYTLARGLATLDHMSKGRAAWRLAPRKDDARSVELVVAVRKLLLSWGADALLADAENGLLSDPDQVHTVAHEGRFFSVEGPLNIPQPPQGRVPLIAFDDEPAIARIADLVVNRKTVWNITLDSVPRTLPGLAGPGPQPFLARIGESL